jgi:carbonic anhydrase
MTTTGRTAEEVLQELLAGNRRYAAGAAIRPHCDPHRRCDCCSGQDPGTVVVTCSDSRVPPELIFDQGLGDLFVVRTAGHVLGAAAMGSIQYAAEHLSVPLVLVLGHTSCGAVTAAVEDAHPDGDLGLTIEQIRPAVAQARRQGGDLLAESIKAQVRITAERIRVAVSGPRVVGAIYDLATGVVSPLE